MSVSRLNVLPLLFVGASVCFAPTGCGDGFQDIERDEDSGVTTSDGGDSNVPGNLDAGEDAATSSKFGISTSVSSIYLDRGEQNVALQVSITRAPSFTTPVTISVNGLPSAVHVSALTLADGDTSGTLFFGADPTAILGGATISVLGVAGDHTARTSLALYIAGQMDFDTDGSFIVPQLETPTLDFYLWGAGGGGGGTNDKRGATAAVQGGNGGAGGAAVGRVAVTPGEQLTIRVGARGNVVAGPIAGSGGGFTSVMRGETPLLMAGGGGGGGHGFGYDDGSSAATGDGGDGGAGGGTAGKTGTFTGGQGGSANAGGAAGNADVKGKAGESFLGGYGAGASATNGTIGGLPGGGGGYFGGGGGGGYFGGGGGGHYSGGSYNRHGTGGGGGSGYAESSVLPLNEGALLIAGASQTPPLTDSPYYVTGVGVGGTQGSCTGSPCVPVLPTPGGNGRVVVVLAKP